MAERPANSAAPLLDAIEEPGPAEPEAARRVRVLLPLPLRQPLDYLVAEDMTAPPPGSFVRVGLGSRQLIGVMWEADEEGSPLPTERLKPLGEILPAPPLRRELRRFVQR